VDILQGDRSRPRERGFGKENSYCIFNYLFFISDMFRRAGFDVLLLDEYKTSKVCPGCEGDTLDTFKRRENPKPWRNDEVTVHGLLRCQSENCQQSCGHPSRLWNRDDVATLNQKSIVESMMVGGGRPARFRRTLPE
jgi:hypothetical protein